LRSSTATRSRRRVKWVGKTTNGEDSEEREEEDEEEDVLHENEG
jgi:hypothetical protein